MAFDSLAEQHKKYKTIHCSTAMESVFIETSELCPLKTE